MDQATTSVAPATTPDKKKFQGSYREYLASPEWERTAYNRKLKSNNRCAACRSNKRIEVHHLTYSTLGHESMDDLMALCHCCHKFAHSLWPSQPSHLPSKVIATMTFYFLRNYSNSKRLLPHKRTAVIPQSLSDKDAKFLKDAILKRFPETVFGEPKPPTPRDNSPRKSIQTHRTLPKPKGKQRRLTVNRTKLSEPSRQKWTSKLTTRHK